MLRKVLVKAVFDVKPTSNVGDVFQPEFEGNILSLEGNLKCAWMNQIIDINLCACIIFFLTYVGLQFYQTSWRHALEDSNRNSRRLEEHIYHKMYMFRQ